MHLSRRAWIAIVILPVILAILIRNLDNIAPLSLIANVLLIFSMGVVVYKEIDALT